MALPVLKPVRGALTGFLWPPEAIQALVLDQRIEVPLVGLDRAAGEPGPSEFFQAVRTHAHPKRDLDIIAVQVEKDTCRRTLVAGKMSITRIVSHRLSNVRGERKLVGMAPTSPEQMGPLAIYPFEPDSVVPRRARRGYGTLVRYTAPS